MAKCLRDICSLPESELPWKAGRGFVVRDLSWTVEKLRVILLFEFENWAGLRPWWNSHSYWGHNLPVQQASSLPA